MKKNFLKKLAFTMAFATAFTALSPAAGVFAAAKPSLTVGKTLTLLLGTDRAENDINVKNKVKGSKYAWSTSNKAVATVDKNGVVVGKTTGTAKVTLKITLPTKKTQTLTTTVNVKDNIKEVAINNAPEKAIKVGEEYDFNRTIVSTFGGNKKAHKGAVTRWEIVSENKEKATINDAGVFVAEEAGEYEIVAISFQSKAKYADYLKGKDTVTAKSESVKVKVENTITSFKAVKSNTLEVTFASAIEKADLANYEIRDTKTSQKVYVKNVTLSADKKVATLELYNALVHDNVYELTATIDKVAMKAELKFVRGVVTRIEAVNQLVKADGNPHSIVYAVYDENGLDITAETVVHFESSIAVVNGQINLAHGVIAYVTVVYTDYATGKQVKSQQFTVTGSNAIANVLEGYSLSDNGNPNFTTPSTTLGVNDTTKTLYVQIVDQFGVKRTAANGIDVEFESLDPNIVVVDKITGRVTPVRIGTGYVKIISAGTTVNRIVPITVREASNPKDIQAPATAKGSMTGAAANLNNPSIWIPVVDQYGDNTVATLTFTLLNGAGVLADFPAINSTLVHVPAHAWDYSRSFRVTAPGTAYLRVDAPGLASKYVAITVTGVDTYETGYTVSGIKKLNVDKAYNNNASDDKDTTLEVYTVNRNGERIAAVTDAVINVTHPWGHTSAVTAVSVTDGFINHTTGTYRIAAVRNGATIFTGSFEVVDTATAPVVTLKRNILVNGGDARLSTLVANFNVPGNYTVTDIQYTSSNVAQIASRTFNDVDPAVGGFASLYNIKVQVRHTSGRIFTVSVTENLTLSR